MYTAHHLALLHHAATALDDHVMARGQTRRIVDIAVRHAVDAPYLIDQVLALSALHLATSGSASTPSSSSALPRGMETPSVLRHAATELQTRAVACFIRHTSPQQQQQRQDADDASVPRILFASTLSLHVLADTLADVGRLPFHRVLDRFVECLRLHHGVRAVIRPTWEHLERSEIEPLLSVARAASTPTARDRHECRRLTALLDASDLGPSTLAACRAAVDILQWAFDMYAHLDDVAAAGPHAASVFCVTVGSDYVDVLQRHQPEALVILAHYAVLLHRCRAFWAFGPAGAAMVRAVAHHLGDYWAGAMAWPLRLVADENS